MLNENSWSQKGIDSMLLFIWYSEKSKTIEIDQWLPWIGVEEEIVKEEEGKFGGNENDLDLGDSSYMTIFVKLIKLDA